GYSNLSTYASYAKIDLTLFRLFMNSDASLKSLIHISDETIGYFLSAKSEIYRLILDYAKFISNVKNINLRFPSASYRPNSNLFYFLITLPSLIPTIKHLSICDNTNKLFASNLNQLQTQLLSLSLYKLRGIDLLDSFKYCFNTLTLIKFEYCNFTNLLSYDVLRNLTQLKSLHFVKCSGVTTPLKIKSLKIIGWFPGLPLLLQKVGTYLEYLELSLIGDNEREASFESIMSFCDKIKFLYLSNFDKKNVTQLFELITRSL
ncbi:4316_t:CDS:1, partial [Funneliformis geosporum]